MQIQRILGACALALLVASSASAEGGVPVGEAAPDFGAADFINTEPVRLSALKGRLVLLELFTTT